MNVACHFTGLRWMDSGPRGFRKPGWCTKFESLIETSHFDQVWCDHKCKLREMNRTFEIQMVTADLPTEDLVRLIMSELQDRQIGTTRMTTIWPERPLHSEELGPAKIIVVVQSEGAQEGALIFHQNARFNRYSWKNQGLRCQEPRPERHRNARKIDEFANWNIKDLWDSQQGLDQLAERDRTKKHHGVPNAQSWGRLRSISPDTPLYQISDL